MENDSFIGIYSDTQLSSLDWKTFTNHVLANELSSYTVETLLRVIKSVIRDDEEIMSGIRFRSWFPSIILKHNSKNKVYEVGRYDKPIFIYKILQTCKYTSELNDLRNKCILFPYIYKYFTAGTPIDDGSLCISLFGSQTQRSEQVLMEIVKHDQKVDSYLRFNQNASFDDYMKIFIQVVKGMDLATSTYGYVNGNLNVNTILLGIENEEVKIPIGNKCLRTKLIVRLSNCSIAEDRSCNDVYTFLSSFLYNLLLSHNKSESVKKMSTLIIDIMLKLKIPIYYINKINRAVSCENAKMSDDLYFTFSDVSKLIEEVSREFIIDEEVNLRQQFPLSFSCLIEEKITHLYYSGEPYSSAYIQSMNVYMSKIECIKKYVDNTFDHIDDLSVLKNYNVIELINLSDEKASQYYQNVLDYFESLLFIKLLLDDLNRRLAYLEDLYDTLENSIIKNFIIENRAKLSRKAIENIGIYNKSYLTMKTEDINKIKSIWNTLSEEVPI